MTNTKVYVNGKSKEIQEKLLEIGFSWFGVDEIQCLYYPFLYLNDKSVKMGCNMANFSKDNRKEVSAEDILNIKLDHEFKPFDKVLVRNTDYQKWQPSFFSYKRDGFECPYMTINGWYIYCIPYEGNEKLLGTANNPND